MRKQDLEAIKLQALVKKIMDELHTGLVGTALEQVRDELCNGIGLGLYITAELDIDEFEAYAPAHIKAMIAEMHKIRAKEEH